MPLFKIKKIIFQYPSSVDFKLRPTDLTVEPGDLIGFLGPNGAGKSTLLRLMAGLLEPQEGEILFEGRSLDRLSPRERARKIAYVPQSTRFAFPLTVGEIVEMGRHPYLARFEPLGKKDRAICERALELCDVLKFKTRFYEELSGGEKQRVLLASALAQTPSVLLLDEPTLSLDLSHQILFFEIIRKLHREQAVTVVVATHELNLAGTYLNRLLLMKEGKVVAEGPPGKVLTMKSIKEVMGVEVERFARRGDTPAFVPKSLKAVGGKAGL